MIVAAVLTISCGKAPLPDGASASVVELNGVQIIKVAPSSIEDFYEATGTVKAKTTTQVSANMMGRIVSFPVAEGDTVGRGQVIVEIDNSESKAQMLRAQGVLKEARASLTEVARSAESAAAGVRSAEANRKLAEVTFGRYKELFERGSASAQEYDEAQSKFSFAKAEVERARANEQAIIAKNRQINARIEQAEAEIANTRVYQGYARIVSPVSGVVVKKFAESGATATPGAPLLSIEDNSQYRLEASVDESRSGAVRLGNRVNVRIDAIGEGEFIGSVAEILPTADPVSRSYVVKIDLPADPRLKTGLYGLARFPVSQKEALTVPESALTQRGQMSGVFVVGSDGIAYFRIVTTGKSSEGTVEVLSGLSEGDEIAVSNLDRLTDGIKVR